ncbi:Transcription factor MYB78 [Glycine max]|nr:Transcription factor MYB78 [Glycine max]
MAGHMGRGVIEEQVWRKGPWTAEEDRLLVEYVRLHGEGRWNSVARLANKTQYVNGFGENVNHSTKCRWWIALTSSIWQHRNHLIFQGKPFDPYKVMEHANFLAWSWLKAKDKNFSTSFHYRSSNISNFFA